MSKNLHKIGFGGGCHWCTEGVFASLNGVDDVAQGWIKSTVPNDEFSEAVIVHFNPQEIDAQILIHIHLLTHSSTKTHGLRKKYRSAIYYFEKENEAVYQETLENLQSEFEETIITRVMPHIEFKENQKELLNYFFTRPEAPFCENFILPKLQQLMLKNADWLNQKKLKKNQIVISKTNSKPSIQEHSSSID